MYWSPGWGPALVWGEGSLCLVTPVWSLLEMARSEGMGKGGDMEARRE